MFKNYNINQVVLPLDLEIKLQENDIAYAVNRFSGKRSRRGIYKFLVWNGLPSLLSVNEDEDHPLTPKKVEIILVGKAQSWVSF